MAQALRDAFVVDIRCDRRDAPRLASLARRRVPRLAGTSDDTDEDLLIRLRDPRIFGAFAEPLLRDRQLLVRTRRALAGWAFDLLPIPYSEADVFLVESRAPARLLAIAAYLGEKKSLSELHLLHLVYAVFLDRGLVTHVAPRARASVLFHVFEFSSTAPRPCVLYAAMHLAAVPAQEALVALRRVLQSRAFRSEVRRRLAAMAIAEDGGVAQWVRLAQEEGLLPSDEPPTSPAVLANAPRLPERLAAPACAWLGSRPPGRDAWARIHAPIYW